MRTPDTIPCRVFVVAEQDDSGTILNDEIERSLVVMTTTNGGTCPELVLRVEGGPDGLTGEVRLAPQFVGYLLRQLQDTGLAGL
jgi:hypothetical protein